MDTDRNLLFGVLALQADLIDLDRFVQACTLWSAQKAMPLAQLLVKQGWLTPEDCADVEKLLDRKLRKHKGDAHASLAEVTTDAIRQSLAGLDDDVRQSIASTPAAPGQVVLATTAYVPEAGGRYTRSRLHATGGIGRVWLARDTNLSRDVALKELRPERAGNPAVSDRFLKEAQITGQLEHPGIVPIYELGKHSQDEPPFYTMRFVRGRTLSEATRAYHERRRRGEAGPLDLRELLGAFVGVCNVAAYAHSRGVLHRDLKPTNVVLGDFGEVVVLDWGLARLMDQPEGADAVPLDVPADSEVQATLQGQVLGTPAYMAPEQAEGRLDQLGPATDVYGLGAILYEILTGRPPFSGPETTQLLRQVIHELPARPSSLIAGTPRGLEAVCLKALAKKPAERYDSASALASDIRHYLADEPVSAYRDPLAKRLGRKARRHRTLVAGLAAAALVAVISLTAATVLLSAANRRESAARRLAQERGEEAERQSAKARANFQLAREAVEEYCTKVSDDPRLKEKDLEALRKELIQSAVKFHQKFVDQHGDDPALRADLGRAYLDLSALVDEADYKQVVQLSAKATAIFKELIAQYPDDGSYPLQLAQSLFDLGGVYYTHGQAKEARAALERSLQALDSTRRQHGSSPRLQRLYLTVCNQLGYLLLDKLGSQEEAIAVLRRGVALAEEGQVSPATELNDVLAMSKLYNSLGAVLSDSEKAPREGLVWCQKSVQLLQPRLTRTDRPARLLSTLGVAYCTTGRSHAQLRQYEVAVQAYRKSVELQQELIAAHPGVARYQSDLGAYLNNLSLCEFASGQTQEGLASLKRALEVKEQLAQRHPDVPDYQANLVRSLASMAQETTDVEQARAYQRRAETVARELNNRHPGVAQYQRALVHSFVTRAELHQRANEVEQAIAALDEAIVVWEKLVQSTDVAAHRAGLMQVCLQKFDLAIKAGKPDLAADAFQKADALNPRDPLFYYRYGNALMNARRLDGAVVALQKAIALKPDFAEAYCNLGHSLVRKGRFVEGLAALQRGDELGTRRPGWKYPSRSWVQNAERLIQLDGKLTALLKGSAEPADTRERLSLASFCRQYKQFYAASARFYAAAFAEDPKLAEDRKAPHRYNAACVAALAGCGKGADAGKLDDKERARWRKQAHDWLAADLALWTRSAEKPGPADGEAIRKKLQLWQKDTDLAGVRDPTALARLPAEEQAQWRKLWGEVAAVLGKVREK
jgi:serine/threonine-protein kinase